MFEIKNGSEMDNALAAIEKAVYYIRNCASDPKKVEDAIEEMQGEMDNLKNTLEVLRYEYEESDAE